jgi:ribose 5-phosphate isomerase B
MNIAIGADHAGFEYKEKLKIFLVKNKHSVIDCGTNSSDSVDYPDYAQKVVKTILNGRCARGILLCATGVGMAISANRFRGIRAALCHNEYTAEMSRRHNDANIFCAGCKILDYEALEKLIKVWLTTPFEGGRHLNRVKKIDNLR